MADVKSLIEKSKMRYHILTHHGKPWVCCLKFLGESPKGNNWRFEMLNTYERKVISTYHETPPPDSIREAVTEYQKQELLYIRYGDISDLGKALDRILAAERLCDSAEPDSTETFTMLGCCDGLA